MKCSKSEHDLGKGARFKQLDSRREEKKCELKLAGVPTVA